MKKTKRILSLILVIMMLLSSVSVAFGTVTITEIPLRVKEKAQSPGTNIVIFTDSVGTFEVVDIDTSIISNDMLSLDPSTGIVSTDNLGGDTLRSYVTYNNGITWVTANHGEYSSIILDSKYFDIVYSTNYVFSTDGSVAIFDSSAEHIPFQEPANLNSYNIVLNVVVEEDYTTESWNVYQGIVTANKVTKYNTQNEVDLATNNIAIAQEDLVLVEEDETFELQSIVFNPIYSSTSMLWLNFYATGEGDQTVINYTDLTVKVDGLEFLGKPGTAEPATGTFNANVVDVDTSPETTNYIGTLQIKGNFTHGSQIEVVGKNRLTGSDTATALFGGVNFAAYDEALGRVVEADYTIESWNIYEGIIALNVVSPGNTQEQVNLATANILAAQEDLILKPTESDLTAYNQALTSVVEGDYTADSWDAYQLVVSMNVVESRHTQEEVDTATSNIITAQGNLVLKPVEADLTGYIITLSAVNEENYTPYSWGNYKSVVDANVVTASNTQAEVDDAIDNIVAAQIFLEHIAEFTFYNNLISSVDSWNYTITSWTTYKEVVDSFVLTLDSSQSEVDEAVAAITFAKSNLVFKANLESYNIALGHVNESNYTPESWAIYMEVVNANPASTEYPQEVVDFAELSILVAQANLVLKPVDSDLTAYNNALSSFNEEDYTPNSWATYQIVVNNNVVTSSNTQTEVNEATDNIIATQASLVTRAIFTEYNEVIASVIESDYTVESWNSYQARLTELPVTVNLSQYELDGIVDEILMAQSSLLVLEPVGSDLTQYNMILNKVLVESDYTTESWLEYQNTRATNVVTSSNTQKEVDTATENISYAQQTLVFAGRAALNEALNIVNELIYTDYSALSWQALINTIMAPAYTQAEIVQQTADIYAKINGLEKILGDLTELNELFKDMYKADYTAESWETFFDIYTSANVTAEGSLQSEVDSLVVNLTEAKKSLIALPGNVTRYIEAIESVSEEAYTTESWLEYITTINLNMNMSNLQSQIDLCTQDIKNAQLNLVLKEYASLTELHEILNSVEELDYTSESWIGYINTLSTYDVDETMKQVEVDEICLNIREAQKLLIARPAYLGDYEYIVNYFKSEDCTEETWNEFKKVLDANVITSENLQSEVNKATQTINEATAKLLLKSTIERFNKLMNIDNLGYYDSNWEDYTELRGRLISEGVFTNEEYSGAVRELENALSRLGMVFTLEWYDKLIEIGEQYKYKFSEDNWNSYQEILNQNILTESNTFDEIQNGINTVGISLTRLETVDGTQNILKYFLFNSIVDEEDYTESSWKEYQGHVLKLPVTWETDEKELQGILRHLMYEQHFLKLKADLTEYTSLLTSIKQADYVGQSWAIYTEILKNNTLTDESTKEQINLAINNIKVAQANLVKKPTEQGSGGGGGGMVVTPMPPAPPAPPVILPQLQQSGLITIRVGDTELELYARETMILRDNIGGYVNGYSDNTFRPDKSITRAEVSQILSNIFKESGLLKPEIIDISGNWYSQSVEQVLSLGLMRGYEDKTFKPEKNITRQEFAVTLVNMLDLSKMPTVGDKSFTDVDNSYGKDSIKLLASLGILQGYDDGTFRPDTEITRAEVVVIINRLLGDRIPQNAPENNPGNMNPNMRLTDIENSWAKYEIMRAAGK